MADADLDVLLVAGRFEARGSCLYTVRLAHRLAAQRVSARIAAADARIVAGATRAGLRLTEYQRIEMPVWGRVVRRFLLHDLLEAPPELIHVQWPGALPVGTWLARRLSRPLVLTVHDFLPRRTRLRVDRRWCRRIIAVSSAVRDDLLLRTGLPPDLVTVIPGGVEVVPEPSRPLPLEPGHVPVIGTAGPLEAVKGFPYFLGAAHEVLAAKPKLEFLVAGAGPEEANLRRLARELGISDRVTFAPYVFDFRESLAAMDIFCLPSLRQGLGTIMLEAMSLGRPVIATGVGGVDEVLDDGRTGLIVPPQNSHELARRIVELLSNPTRARALGEAGRSLVAAEFNAERMASQTAALYREVLRGAHRSPGSTVSA